MANLKTIPGGTALVRAEHYDSLVAAFNELTAAAGFAPRVLGASEVRDGIPGGARTLAEARRAGSGTASDHYEDNARGHAAIDIDNQRAFRNKIGSSAFEAILAKHGWRNIQINGAPFPSEPWHFARHVTVAGPVSAPKTRNGFAVSTIQARVNAAGYTPKLIVDGVYGRATTAGVRWLQSKVGAAVDGDYGPETDAKYLVWASGSGAPTPTSGKLLVDGVRGPATVRRLQEELTEEGHNPGPIDGEFGPRSSAALQRKLNVKDDGVFGPISTRALQAYLGVTVDGAWGPQTTSALQTRLNEDTF